MNVARHDPDLDLIGRDHSWTVRADQNRFGTRHFSSSLDHIPYRYSFGDANHQIQFSLDSLINSGRCKGRRYINHRNRRTGLLFRFRNRIIDRHTFNHLATLARCYTRDKGILPVGIVQTVAGMEHTGLAGHSLCHHTRVAIDQYRHVIILL